MAFKVCFSFFLFFVLLACDFESSEVVLESQREEINFIKSNSPDDRVIVLSKKNYNGSPLCDSNEDCREVCYDLFYDSSVQDQCLDLNAQQVYQFERLYEHFLTEDLNQLKKIQPFDLKVFFALSSEILFDVLKSIPINSLKTYLIWIVEDWQVAMTFQEEDSHFVYMQLFLNQLNHLPIRSLQEKLKEDQTFVELAWLKQNDKALEWLDNYLEKSYCDFESDKTNCKKEAYCMLYKSWDQNIVTEIETSSRFISKLGNGFRFEESCKNFCELENCDL